MKDSIRPFFMLIYEPEAHSTLCRNTHESGVHTRTMKMSFLNLYVLAFV